MNPYIAHELMNDHNREMLDQARRGNVASRLRSMMRAERRERASIASTSVPEIPDYVHELLDGAEVDASRTC
jgi:hypothetical protein